jgi:6-phosphogluconolactonase
MNHRRPSLLFVFLSAAIVAGGASAGAAPAAAEAASFHVYFGTYTRGKSKGIYHARLDGASGRLSPAALVAETPDPSFLAVHPDARHLYAIDEGSDPVKTPGRGVSGYRIDARTGALTRLNEGSAGAPGPCHLTVDATGRCVLVANYAGASIAALPLEPDGRLGPPATVVRHTGSSVNPARQQAPHPHVMVVAPDNRFALCADLGVDRVFSYRLEAAKAGLVAASPPSVVLPPGAGPRHLAFRPDGRFVYVINELDCTLAVFGYDAATGGLHQRQIVPTLPAGESVKRGYSTAEVVAHPGGRFLYGSNRGHNSIAVFAIDPGAGTLTALEHPSTGGRTPRHIAIDPTGRWLLAENQDSDTVVVFGIDPRTGRLTPTGQVLAVPVPVCAVFVREG